MFPCVVCKKKFPSTKQLTQHFLIHADKKLFPVDESKPNSNEQASISPGEHRTHWYNPIPQNVSTNTVLDSQVKAGGDAMPETAVSTRFLEAILTGNNCLVRNQILKSSDVFGVGKKLEVEGNQILKSSDVFGVGNKLEVEGKYICVFCQKPFSNKLRLKYHYLSHNSTKPFVCLVCKKEFAIYCNLKAHRKQHCQKNKNMCAFCPRILPSPESLKQHEMRHITEINKTKTSDILCCDDFVSEEATVESLSNRKTSATEFRVEVECLFSVENDAVMSDGDPVLEEADGESTDDTHDLKLSLQESDSIECNDEKSSSSGHTSVFQGEFGVGSADDIQRESTEVILSGTSYGNVWTCEDSEARRQMKDYTETCPVCYKTFKSHWHLRRHSLTHTLKEALICSVCNQHFTNKCKFMAHQKGHSSEIYSCAACPKTFTSRSNFTLHQRRSHNIQFKCPNCDMCFRIVRDLRRHSRLCNKGDSSTRDDSQPLSKEGPVQDIVFSLDEDGTTRNSESSCQLMNLPSKSDVESSNNIQLIAIKQEEDPITGPVYETEKEIEIQLTFKQEDLNESGFNCQDIHSQIFTETQDGPDENQSVTKPQNEKSITRDGRVSIKLERSCSPLNGPVVEHVLIRSKEEPEGYSEDEGSCQTTGVILPDDGPDDGPDSGDQTSNVNVEACTSLAWLESPNEREEVASSTRMMPNVVLFQSDDETDTDVPTNVEPLEDSFYNETCTTSGDSSLDKHEKERGLDKKIKHGISQMKLRNRTSKPDSTKSESPDDNSLSLRPVRDGYYTEYRRKNNIASQKSRQIRLQRNREVEDELKVQTDLNKNLQSKVKALDDMVESMKSMIVQLLEENKKQ